MTDSGGPAPRDTGKGLQVAMGSAIADWLRVGAVAPIVAQVEPGLDRVHEWIEATEAHTPGVTPTLTRSQQRSTVRWARRDPSRVARSVGPSVEFCAIDRLISGPVPGDAAAQVLRRAAADALASGVRSNLVADRAREASARLQRPYG